MVDIIHARDDPIHPGRPACGQVAFRYTERPRYGDAIHASRVRLLDGTTPDLGTLCYCGACGLVVGPAAFKPDGGYA